MVYIVILRIIQHAFNELLCISNVPGVHDIKMNKTRSLLSWNIMVYSMYSVWEAFVER